MIRRQPFTEEEKERIVFGAEMIQVVTSRFKASCSGEDAEPFVNKIYEEYRQAGRPKNIKKWLQERLSDAYQYVHAAPRWVEDEPGWLYLDGEPMVFIEQFTLPKNQVTETKLTWDVTIYLFGARIHVDAKSYKVEHKVLMQDETFNQVHAR